MMTQCVHNNNLAFKFNSEFEYFNPLNFNAKGERLKYLAILNESSLDTKYILSPVHRDLLHYTNFCVVFCSV